MEETMTLEQSNALMDLAKILSINSQKEADAVVGYTEQLKAITRVAEACAGMPEILEFLDKLTDETNEKISDELNHNHSLLDEYQELTGIQPAKE